jgi:hypothetical protein
MQPDARRRADTLSWFEKAHKDLRCAQIDLAADPPASEDALYHCQQAAAKALKGFLVRHDHILTIRGGYSAAHPEKLKAKLERAGNGQGRRSGEVSDTQRPTRVVTVREAHCRSFKPPPKPGSSQRTDGMVAMFRGEAADVPALPRNVPARVLTKSRAGPLESRTTRGGGFGSGEANSMA